MADINPRWMALALSIAIGAGGVAAATSAIGAATPPRETMARRCGWIANPTPGNWWLTDRDGQWTLSTQGGPGAAGMDSLPDLTVREWKAATPAGYGYGCGCMTVRAPRGSKDVTAISGFRQMPLATCRGDRRLKRR